MPTTRGRAKAYSPKTRGRAIASPPITRGRAKPDSPCSVPITGRDLLFARQHSDSHYPGDPRFCDSIRLLPEYIVSLEKTSSSDAYLSDNFLDILLKEGAGRPPSSSVDSSQPIKFLASTLSFGSMVSYIESVEEYDRKNGGSC